MIYFPPQNNPVLLRNKAWLLRNKDGLLKFRSVDMFAKYRKNIGKGGSCMLFDACGAGF